MKSRMLPVVLVLVLVCGSFLRADGPAQATPETLPHTVMCPRQIQTRESLASPIPGWDVYVIPSRFDGISIYTGDPARGMLFMPTENEEELQGPDDDRWIFCSYTGTRLAIARPIGKFVKGCQYVVVPKEEGYNPVPGVSCE